MSSASSSSTAALGSNRNSPEATGRFPKGRLRAEILREIKEEANEPNVMPRKKRKSGVASSSNVVDLDGPNDFNDGTIWKTYTRPTIVHVVDESDIDVEVIFVDDGEVVGNFPVELKGLWSAKMLQSSSISDVRDEVFGLLFAFYKLKKIAHHPVDYDPVLTISVMQNDPTKFLRPSEVVTLLDLSKMLSRSSPIRFKAHLQRNVFANGEEELTDLLGERAKQIGLDWTYSPLNR